MRAFLQLPVNNEKYGRILHITDTHLFANDNDKLLGINSNASFLSVIEEIDKRHEQYDLIVATGDFVQDGSKKAYQRFASQIKKFAIPCVWLAGNHDNFIYMQEVFNHYQLVENKVVLLGSKWLIVLLNSQVVGQAYGFLAPAELLFLKNTLERHSDRTALVFLHHNPITSSCSWLDQHILKNSDELEQIIENYPMIKGLGWGHIHQQQDLKWHNCTVFSTPSTCVQFKPNCVQFQLSNQDAPGWREITLNADGTLKTEVYRISNNRFLPDLSKNGY